MSPAVSLLLEDELPHVRPCPPSSSWILPDVTMPESNPHRIATERLRDILTTRLARGERGGSVVSNLAIRWDEAHPAVGLDPDVALLDPPPPEGAAVRSLLLWKAGHHVPPLAVEIVSSTNAAKDYDQAPLRYASLGVTELWVLDPERVGPAANGGPHALQLWSCPRAGGLTRLYAGDGPAYSPYLDSWLVQRPEAGVNTVRLAEDVHGHHLWPTAEETALARVAELEAALAEVRRR